MKIRVFNPIESYLNSEVQQMWDSVVKTSKCVWIKLQSGQKTSKCQKPCLIPVFKKHRLGTLFEDYCGRATSFYDHCCTSVWKGQKSLVISETGHKQVRHDDPDMTSPFDVQNHDFFMNFEFHQKVMIFMKFIDISRKSDYLSTGGCTRSSTTVDHMVPHHHYPGTTTTMHHAPCRTSAVRPVVLTVVPSSWGSFWLQRVALLTRSCESRV